MSSETSIRLDYVDHMAGPFVSALSGFDLGDTERLPESSLELWVLPHLSQTAVRAALVEADLDETDLPWRPARNGALSPQEFAERLTAFAYDDALTLLHITDATLRNAGFERPKEISQILKDSTKQLVSIASLDESSKSKLVSYLKRTVLDDPYAKFYPSLPTQLRAIKDGDALTYNPELRKMQWHPYIKAWIDKIATNLPQSGCPAHKKVIEANNKKQLLTHYFWRKLVDIAYSTAE